MIQLVQSWCKAIQLAVFITVLCLAPMASRSQECERSIAGFPEPSAERDSIFVKREGGRPHTLVAAAIDEFGKVSYFRNGGCLVQSDAGAIEASEFATLLNEFRQALEQLRRQPPNPTPTTLQQILAILERGRLEPTCMSHLDGIDVEISAIVSGNEVTLPCVTGPLKDFGYSVLRTATNAVNTDVGYFGE